ncbi:MAG: radical SAM protein [Thermotogaceae bacterium]|nr:radical SAM protein [Thermotogaceae bacterium]
MKAILIDGYIDEPAALGVPPYISPYIRYIYGALLMKGFDVIYKTIDSIRKGNEWKFNTDYIIIYGGTTVPGHYLSGTPVFLSEVRRIIKENLHSKIFIGGPIAKAYTIKGGSKAITSEFEGATVIPGDIWAFFYNFPYASLSEKDTYKMINDLSIAGAEILKAHPDFPDVICEIEVSRGCERKSFCSFCTEPILHGRLRSRDVEGIVKEVEILCKNGCRAYRLGRSANIIAYMSDKNNGFPSPGAILDLYSGIRNVCPDLEVLHTDNANPSYIVKYEKEARKVIEIITEYNTPGDVLAFGAESFDENVLKKNNIGSGPKEVRKAIKIVNEIGSLRVNGIPKLLPGINLLYGLIGETEDTYEKNYAFLKEVLDDGLLLRRINIRQVMVYPDTPLYRYYQTHKFKLNKKLFNYWKEKIRKDIDEPMIKRVFPKGAVIKGAIPEKKKGNITFMRPLGTYPVLIGTYSKANEKSDMIIVAHGRRSLTAVRAPFDINEASFKELLSIEGIGRSRAEEIIMKRPFKDVKYMKEKLDKETFEAIKDLLEVNQ